MYTNKQLFDQKTKTYQKPLENIYKSIVFFSSRGQMHKMHKKKEILKNLSEMTQKIATLKRKRE
jgi:alkyl hydroperoxide reductase subunit AhpF